MIRFPKYKLKGILTIVENRNKKKSIYIDFRQIVSLFKKNNILKRLFDTREASLNTVLSLKNYDTRGIIQLNFLHLY